MKQFITTASLCLLMSHFLVAQEKVNAKTSATKTEKITIKKENAKEPCFTSEFDANGKETKVPCGTKSKTVTVANNTKSLVPVHTELDKSGKEKNYMIEFDKDGKEIKRYGKLIEEFDATGKSSLLFIYKTPVGKDVILPAERK